MSYRNYIDALERIEFCIVDQENFSHSVVYGFMGALFLLGVLVGSQMVVTAMLALYVVHGIYLVHAAQALYDSLDQYQDLLDAGSARRTIIPLWHCLIWASVSPRHYGDLTERATRLKTRAVDTEILR